MAGILSLECCAETVTCMPYSSAKKSSPLNPCLGHQTTSLRSLALVMKSKEAKCRSFHPPSSILGCAVSVSWIERLGTHRDLYVRASSFHRLGKLGKQKAQHSFSYRADIAMFVKWAFTCIKPTSSLNIIVRVCLKRRGTRTSMVRRQQSVREMNLLWSETIIYRESAWWYRVSGIYHCNFTLFFRSTYQVRAQALP